MNIFVRFAVAIAVFGTFSACAKIDPTNEPQRDMDEFRLGHNVVIAKNATPGPLTRSIEKEEIGVALRAAVDERLGAYSGTRLLHVGVAVDAYVLALPGLPAVLSPKSVLALTVNIWDNVTQQKLNEEPRRFTVFERTTAATIVGSGLTQTKDMQLQNLSRNAALKIQNWILEYPDWISSVVEGE
ncbi:hypothetical protein [Halocynthiibacter namhaensis]|uniref:hypothetical protein n=1 Tax=Halocynthiibacter namhaensis TaxID=1290553 RepID=UPI00068AEE32|nr:hypothetical protein [Halocynthiibacter namhaensis]